jgi:Xaa-Pro aminopeptidase
VSASPPLSKSAALTAPIDALREWMSGRHLEVLYLSRPVSIAYLTGFFAEPHERLMGLAINRQGATLIVPALEQQKAGEQASGVEVVGWRDGEDPYALVARALAGAAEVGVEKEHMSLHAAEVITTRTGASELVDVGAEIRRMRLIKNDDEIARLARAAAITDQVTERLLARLRAGMSELEVAFTIASLIGELGGTLSFPSLVQSGPNSAMPHIEPTSRKLAGGDFVLLDFGAAFGGYKADTTRMAVVGEPSTRHREIHRVVLEAHDAAIDAVRAGVTSGEVDVAARRVIDAAGYGDRFFHRVGHGLGLEGHEDPSMDPGSRTVLEPGMVFTIEPGVYIPGFGGVRIEDDVVVTEDGCRVLTQADRSLRVI